MAQLEISREQAQGQWPPCCARCGADGDHIRTRRWWYPPAVAFGIIFPIFLFNFLALRRIAVTLPFCKRHEKHWFYVEVVQWVSLAASFVALSGFVFIATLLERYPGSPWLAWIGRNASNLTVAFFSLLLLWSGALFFMQVQAVRPSEANDTLVLLTGLAEEFVQQFIDDQDPADDDAPAPSPSTPPAEDAITAQAPPRNEP